MIACVGESLIDRIGDKCLIGGCPLNVAVAASRLGAPVTFFGRISSDEFGRSILERMIDDGVLFDPQNCNAAQPTLCSKAVIGQDGKASYTFDYEQTAACSMTEAELSASFANEGDINLVFFGSISLLMEPMCNAIVPAMRTIATNPAWFLDPSVAQLVRIGIVGRRRSRRRQFRNLAGERSPVREGFLGAPGDDELGALLLYRDGFLVDVRAGAAGPPAGTPVHDAHAPFAEVVFITGSILAGAYVVAGSSGSIDTLVQEAIGTVDVGGQSVAVAFRSTHHIETHLVGTQLEGHGAVGVGLCNQEFRQDDRLRIGFEIKRSRPAELVRIPASGPG